MIYIIIITLLVIGYVYYKSSGKKSIESNRQSNSVIPTHVNSPIEDNPYEGLRKMAFSVSAESIGLDIPDDQTIVFGIVEDFVVGSGIATLVAFKTGDASIYLSNGGGFIGGVGTDLIREAAIKFVDKGNSYLSNAFKTDNFPSPKKGEIYFYFLTNKGVYSAKESFTNLKSTPWGDLFYTGDKVVSAIRVQSQVTETNEL